MKILSLFDGMACGMIAMLNAGIEVESYDAYEIDKYAIKVSTHNFPTIRQHGDVFEADFTKYEGVDFLIGGSPCTYWSIAQKNNRETEASGMGWELFSQYVRAVKEAKPKFFIYENNKSMSAAIRASIDKAFGFEAVYINSALVSAQNRQRLYWVGMQNPDGTYSKVPVDQPEDRGILLRDILESCVAEQAYELQSVGIGYRGRMEDDKWVKRYESNDSPKANAITTVQTDSMVAEPVGTTTDGKAYCLTSGYMFGMETDRSLERKQRSHVAEPVRIPEYGEPDKSRPVTACYAYKGAGEGSLASEDFPENPNKQVRDYVAEPIRIGDVGSTAQAHRVYSCDGKSVTINAGGGGQGGKTGLYLCPAENVGDCQTIEKAIPKLAEKLGYIPEKFNAYNLSEITDKSPTLSTGSMVTSRCATTMFVKSDKPVYEVKNGLITIKGKQYPIKLADGYYIIRKLTVTECMRLQTVPEWYDFSVISNSQAYKCLGNGWTCDVITHLINATQKASRKKWLYDLLGDCL